MGVWLLGADVLARGRFVVSPLAETMQSLIAFHRESPGPGRGAWLARHLPAYRALVSADPWTATLVRAAIRPRWLADFLVVPPAETGMTFEEELREVRRTPAAEAFADLAVATNGAAPPELDVPDLPERAARLLEWVWETAVRPEWPRLRRVFEADIVARTQRLSTGGWAAALGDMRTGMAWLGDGRLQINTLDNPPRTIHAGAQLMFIPTTAKYGCVGWQEHERYAVIYPCAGLLAEPAAAATPEALRRLLGPARAEILVRLDAPASTTQLVALTGRALGSVGDHLKVLLDARLIRRRRTGRSVLYYRTPLGDRLVRPH
ncbi:helix-turn-helix domain-containing protein [Streptosporangiaceae bacterium NEAU-GS5]|nr:helix-turn-helix domain-containing protein [Streptosporangiaceae bacterium NEAU-GS5]